MIENVPQEAPEQPTDETPEPAPSPEPQDPRLDTARKEAGRYRRELRDTQAALEKTAAQLEALQTQVVETSLPDHLKPELFWRLTTGGLPALLDDEGSLDSAKVEAATKEAVDLIRPRTTMRQVIRTDGKYPKQPVSTGPSWDDTLKAAAHPRNQVR